MDRRLKRASHPIALFYAINFQISDMMQTAMSVNLMVLEVVKETDEIYPFGVHIWTDLDRGSLTLSNIVSDGCGLY